MKKLFLLLIFLFQYYGVWAIPAYPYKIPIVVNGKEIYIRLFGDEYNKSAESEDGYTIIQNEKHQWCYARINQNSNVEASQWLLGTEQTGNKDLQEFLKTAPKHFKAKNTKVNSGNSSARNLVQKVEGKRKMLIILMEYRDLAFSKSKLDFDRLFNEEGYNDDHAQGSVKDFYFSASYGQLDLESDIYGPYTSKYEMNYYGKNTGKNGDDTNAYALFEEAINYVAREVNLKQYDGDGDGFIDNVHIIFAGYGEEAGAVSNAIWSHEATFRRPYEIQGMKIDRYSCAPELRGNSGNGISRIGPHCHEIGHALGAMDYYDTDYETGGNYQGTGKWDIMASGSWNNEGITPADFNPYVKAYNYGWISPKPLPIGPVEILPSFLGAENYFFLRASEYDDYYLLENRSKEKWGSGVPGEGLLIFHVSSDILNAGNEINASAPQKCYVVCASSNSKRPAKTPNSYGDINSDGCPYPGRSKNHDFGQKSTPEAFYWSETTCGIEINNITLTSDGTIQLINNSTDSGYVPMEMTTLLFEGFEQAPQVTFEQQNAFWQIVDNPENTQSIVDKPVAYEGVKSLQLSARNMNKDIVDAIQFSCQKGNEKGKLRLKLFSTSMHLNFNKPNIVKVGYKVADNAEWIYRDIKSSENSKWHQSIIELPQNTLSLFRIEGTAFAGSILAIDNIEIEQEIINEETGVGSILSDECHELKTTIYTLLGHKLQNVQTGINIVRMSDGTYKKVFIK